MSGFLKNAIELLSMIESKEQLSLNKAAELMYNSIVSGGIIQLFGSGHSQLLAQESYYRAGGLVPAKPISIEPLMLHKGALTSSNNEKDISRIEEYWSEIELQENDTLIVISTSGRNAVPLEIALRAKEMGITVITIQSLDYTEQASRHSSGKRLEDVADVVLNTHTPVGDGVLQSQNLQYGPVSTIAGSAMLNEAIAQVVQMLQQSGGEVPVFGSSNVERTEDMNAYYIEQYKDRINFD